MNPLLTQLVWAKAHYVDPANEAKGFRKDNCGAWIYRYAYGNRDHEYGWEIDHSRPKAHGGSDYFGNLRPLHWRNNAAKSAGPAVCAVRANGVRNEPAGLLSLLSLLSRGA